VLLLDDCTSALDAETEGRILAALRSLSGNRTCLIVSHKVSSVSSADRIVVIDGGRIVEEGPHETLILRDGAYANAHRQQTQPLEIGRSSPNLAHRDEFAGSSYLQRIDASQSPGQEPRSLRQPSKSQRSPYATS